MRDIAPALQRISDKFDGEDITWDDPQPVIDEDISHLPSEATQISRMESVKPELSRNKAYANWTPKRKRSRPHQFFAG